MTTEQSLHIPKEKDPLETPETFCQVKSVIDQKLIGFEGSDLVKNIFWPKVKVDCKQQLEVFSEKFHKLLRVKFLDKGFDLATYECIYDNVVIRGYETLRYKTNAIKYFLKEMTNDTTDKDQQMLSRNLAEIEARKNSIIKTSHSLCTTENNE